MFHTVSVTIGSVNWSHLRQRQGRQRTSISKVSQLFVAGAIFHLKNHISFARKSAHFILIFSDASFIAACTQHITRSESTCISALSCFDIFSSMGVESVEALSFRISRRKSSSWNASFHCVSESKPGRRDIMMIMPWSVWFFKRSNERLLPNLLHDSRHRDECWLHFSILCRESSLTRLSSCAKYFVLESMSMEVFFLVMYRKSCENAGVFRKLRWQFVRTGATLYVKHQLQRRLPLLRRQRLRDLSDLPVAHLLAHM